MDVKNIQNTAAIEKGARLPLEKSIDEIISFVPESFDHPLELNQRAGGSFIFSHGLVRMPLSRAGPVPGSGHQGLPH